MSSSSGAGTNYLTNVLADVKKNIKTMPLGNTLMEQRKLAVFRGNPKAQILIVGEAPGLEEMREGKPFVGPSGKLLNAMFESVTGKKSDEGALFSNCIFMQPPKNREPTGHEFQTYEPYLRQLICNMPDVRVVVCLGRFSASLGQHGFNTAKTFCKPDSTRIGPNEATPEKLFDFRKCEGKEQRIRVKWNDIVKDLWMVPMTHPSVLLRGSDVSDNFDPDRSAYTKRMSVWIEKLRLALTTLELAVAKSIGEMRKYAFKALKRAEALVDDETLEEIKRIKGLGLGAQFDTYWKQILRPFIRKLVEWLEVHIDDVCKAPVPVVRHIYKKIETEDGRAVLGPRERVVLPPTEASIEFTRKQRSELRDSLFVIDKSITERISRELNGLYSSRAPFSLTEMGLPEREDGAHDPAHPRYLTPEKTKQLIVNTPELESCLRKVSQQLPDATQEKIAVLRDLDYDRTNNVMRMYMETPKRESMMVAVRNLEFCLYLDPHPAFAPSSDTNVAINQEYADSVAQLIQWKLGEAVRRQDKRLVTHIRFVAETKIRCELIDNRRVNTEGYVPRGRTFVKIIFNHHDLSDDIHRELTYTVNDFYRNNPDTPKQKLIVCNHFNAVTQFSYNYEVRMSHWIRFQPNAVQYFKPKHAYGTQIYAVCADWGKAECLELSDKVPFNDGSGLNSGSHAPCVILALDIECASPSFHFPNPQIDPVVTVSMTVQLKSEVTKYDSKRGYVPDEASGYWRLSFQMGPCDQTNLRHREAIFEFSDERCLLDSWASVMLMIDPSYVAGHNVKSFDLTYLFERMAVVRAETTSLGQNRDECMRVDIRTFASIAYGERKIFDLKGMRGWTIVDTLEVYLREKKLPSYALNYICKLYLKDQKDDVPYSALWGLLCGTDADRRRVVDYCLRDAQLVDQLINIHSWTVNMIEFARVNGTVQENRLYTSGQQEKVCAAAQHCNATLKRNILFYTPSFNEKRFNADVCVEKWLVGKDDDPKQKCTWEGVAQVETEDILMADSEAGVSEISEKVYSYFFLFFFIIFLFFFIFLIFPKVRKEEEAAKEQTSKRKEKEAEKREYVVDLASWIRVRNRVDAISAQLDESQFFTDPVEDDSDEESELSDMPTPADDRGGMHSCPSRRHSPLANSRENSMPAASSDIALMEDDDELEQNEGIDSVVSAMLEDSRKKLTVGMSLRIPVKDEDMDEETLKHVLPFGGSTRQEKRHIERRARKQKIRFVEFGSHLVGKQVTLPDGTTYTINEKDLEVATLPMEEVVRRCKEQRKEAAKLLRDKHEDARPKSARELIIDKIKHLEMLMNLQKESSLLSRLEAAYQGATVMPPKPGFHYLLPVICVDFASLYPSIMMAYNISPDTKVFESDFDRFNAIEGVTLTRDMCWKVPDLTDRNMRTGKLEGYYFVKKEVYEGLFPLMEVNLLNARKIAKNEMALYDESIEQPDGTWIPNPNYDPVKYSVFNGRQNQIKVVCNSGYGALGANGLVSDKACAAAVTAWGRIAIELVRDILIERYGADCVGGDTDSVFMTFPGFAPGHALKDGQKQVRIETVKQAEGFSTELETFINSHFRAPMKIAYEKAMFPMLISGKKRYCGIIHEKGKKGRFFSKGMETVRRDSLSVTKNAMMGVFSTIMVVPEEGETMEHYERAVKRRKIECIKIVQDACIKLLKGDVTMSDMTMSKQISRSDYANRHHAHLVVADKMAERGEPPPDIGDRVPYVIVELPDTVGKPGTVRKGYELAEHPDYAVRHSLPINYFHYVDKKMVKPVLRVMQHVLRDVAITNIVKRNTESVMERVGNQLTGRMVRMRTIAESQITPAMIEEEVEQILFETAPKGSRERRNLQTKYMRHHPEMKGRVLLKPKIRAEYSDLAKYVETSTFQSRTEELRQKYGSDVKVGFEMEKRALETARAEAARCLQTCRSCVKQERVFCNAYDCTEYFPRVASQGLVENMEKKLVDLEIDIENLDFLTVPVIPAQAPTTTTTTTSSGKVKIHQRKRKAAAKISIEKKKKKKKVGTKGLQPISNFFSPKPVTH